MSQETSTYAGSEVEVKTSELYGPYSSRTQYFCKHCQGPVLDHSISDTYGNLYCCAGCRIVAKLLGENGWQMFYELMREAQVHPPKAEVRRNYRAYIEELKSTDAVKGLGQWNDKLHSLDLTSTEITCSACSWLIESLLSAKPGLISFRVDFLRSNLHLSYDTTLTSLAEILGELSLFGYTFYPENSETKYTVKKEKRSEMQRIAIAGASFINVMSFSLAEYFGILHGMDSQWNRLFGAYCLLLSIPVLTYCALPLYRRAWAGIKQKSIHIDLPISLGILIAAGLSIWEYSQHRLHYLDSVTGLVFFLLLGRWGVKRFENTLIIGHRWFDKLSPAQLRRLDGKAFEYVKPEVLKAGDRILVLPGEYLALDGVLETNARLNRSILTGESRPVELPAGEAVFAGYESLGEPIIVRILKSIDETRAKNLYLQMESLNENKSNRTESSGPFVKYFTITILLLSLLAFCLHLKEGTLSALRVAASLMIVSCSCALGLARPLSEGLALKKAWREGFHFRSASVLAKLREIRCIIFDKTGTLARDQRELKSWRFVNKLASEEELHLKMVLNALVKTSLHPISQALRRSLEESSLSMIHMDYKEEKTNLGMYGRLHIKKDACETNLSDTNVDNCEIMLVRLSAFLDSIDLLNSFSEQRYKVEASDDLKGIVKQAIDDGYNQAISLNGKLMAMAAIETSFSNDLPSMLQELERLNLHPALASGDDEKRTLAFAKETHLLRAKGGLIPEAKLGYLEEMRSQFGSVMAVGDGFNDGLLLGASDVSLVVQGAALEISTSADIVSASKSLLKLPLLFELADLTKRSTRNTYIVSFTYNGIAISLAFMGLVSPLVAAVLMPLSSLSICICAWLTIRPHRIPKPA